MSIYKIQHIGISLRILLPIFKYLNMKFNDVTYHKNGKDFSLQTEELHRKNKTIFIST